MSVEATTWAWKQKLHDPIAKLLLLAIADAVNDDAPCWLKITTLAKRVETSERSVARKLKLLETRKFIHREKRFGDSGVQLSTLYWVGCQLVRGRVPACQGRVTDSQGEGDRALSGGEGDRALSPPKRRTVIKRNPKEQPRVSDGELPLFSDANGPKPSAKATQKFIDETFERFWLAMPKRVAKGDARKAWATAIKKADPSVIITAAVAYAKSRVGQDRQYDKTPGPWLNAERWLDVPPEPPSSPTVRRITDGII